jgi:hypothetical protein
MKDRYTIENLRKLLGKPEYVPFGNYSDSGKNAYGTP